jgi:hypothetical protein
MTSKNSLTVYFVSCATPKLDEIVIRSFNKFSKNSNFDVKFLIVENTDFNLRQYLESCGLIDNCTVISNNKTQLTYSYGHGDGLEFAKHLIDTDYVFTCHSDTCVSSYSFFDEIEKCINEDVDLAGVCEDTHPDRVRAYHCSGLLVKTNLFKTISLMPDLPKIDTTDLLTVHCRNSSLKMKLFRNTYNDSNLCDICNSPFREMGKSCGVDRCLDSNDSVMFIHQGRGTSKMSGAYNAAANKKVSTDEWIDLCNQIISSN